MARIIKATEKIKIDSIKMLIYGEPGVGKTSVSFTSESPLCVDVDNGAHRSIRLGDTLDVSSYEELLDFFLSTEWREQSGYYQTIIIDTAGQLINLMILDILKNEISKYGAQRPGQFFNTRSNTLTLQGYGVLKSVFRRFLTVVTNFSKDVIFIAHETSERNVGEENKKIPAVPGGSYDILLQSMDFIGYMSVSGENRILDFSPSNLHYGKDSGEMGRIIVPTIPPAVNFLAQKIKEAKKKMGAVIVELSDTAQKVDEYRRLLLQVQDINELNNVYAQLKTAEPIVQSVTKPLLLKKSKELKAKFLKEKDVFTFVENV